MPQPCRSARSEALWMTGPSATGSLNGTPSSITVAPASANSTRRRPVVSRSGSPAVMKGIRPRLPSRLRPAKAPAILLIRLRDRMHVFVAAPGEVHDHDLILCHFARDLEGVGDGVCGFERGRDAFEPRKCLEGFERFGVRGRDVLDAPRVVEVGVLRADGRIIQAGRD